MNCNLAKTSIESFNNFTNAIFSVRENRNSTNVRNFLCVRCDTTHYRKKNIVRPDIWLYSLVRFVNGWPFCKNSRWTIERRSHLSTQFSSNGNFFQTQIAPATFFSGNELNLLLLQWAFLSFSRIDFYLYHNLLLLFFLLLLIRQSFLTFRTDSTVKWNNQSYLKTRNRECAVAWRGTFKRNKLELNWNMFTNRLLGLGRQLLNSNPFKLNQSKYKYLSLIRHWKHLQ